VGTPRLRLTAEGYLKHYANVPVSIWNNASMANFGASFGTVGNEPARPGSEGRAYGVEVFAQLKPSNGFHGTASYTFQRSMFNNGSGPMVASAWDSRHAASVLVGKTFAHDVAVSARQYVVGGTPYTPYNTDRSAYQSLWQTSGDPVVDYSRLNTQRTRAHHQLDIRVEKTVRWAKSHAALTLYVDIQNVYNQKKDEPPMLLLQRNSEGQPLVDPTNSARYLTRTVSNFSGTTIPFVGAILRL
jgi:hypothetical protein